MIIARDLSGGLMTEIGVGEIPAAPSLKRCPCESVGGMGENAPFANADSTDIPQEMTYLPTVPKIASGCVLLFGCVYCYFGGLRRQFRLIDTIPTMGG